MKNKLVILLLMSLLTSSLSFSQIKFGIRGGINSSRLNSSTEVITGDYKINMSQLFRHWISCRAHKPDKAF